MTTTPRNPEPTTDLPVEHSQSQMRVVIADDHQLMLAGIRRALEADGGFEIVGETRNGAEVAAIVDRAKPELVLLDVRMPNVDGLACLDDIKRRHPEIKVVMLSASQDEQLIETALRRGASAYLVKNIDVDDLPSTLRQALEGNIYRAVGAPGEIEARGARAAGLTEREISILTALSRGLSNDEIAKEFWVARQTVKFHLTNIYRKLAVRNRAEAMRKAYSLGLVEHPLPGNGDE
jgi:DNA-binding NarL/FixJ family response regulator